MNATFEKSEAAIMERMFHPESGKWPRAAAEAILTIGFDRFDRAEMVALLEKAKAGELSAEESESLERYRHLGRFLELMKSKARRSLANPNS